MFMQLRIYFNVVCHVLVGFLTCTWIIWVIRKYFQQIIWWQWEQVIRRNFDIFSCRMDTFLFLRVLYCGFAVCWYSGTCCSLFVQASIPACFFCSFASFCAFLIRLYFIQDSSWRWRSSYLSWVLLIVSLCRNKSSNTFLASFIMRKAAEAFRCLFLSGWNWRASLRYDFSNHPLLKTHWSKEHDNAKTHPPNPESIEELADKRGQESIGRLIAA